ncbi:MAG: hypothetical protein PHS82_15860 [Lachnospiraceae bacterium]|nr:hypothetical protein [Lachnospiraceae bacterium]
MISGWMAIHEMELYEAWNNAVQNKNRPSVGAPERLSKIFYTGPEACITQSQTH